MNCELLTKFPCFCEVLASRWQLVPYDAGQQFLELQEEAFSGCVAVGVHVAVDAE